MNPTEDVMTVLCCIGIKIGDDNNPAPENAPE